MSGSSLNEILMGRTRMPDVRASDKFTDEYSFAAGDVLMPALVAYLWKRILAPSQEASRGDS